MNHSDCCEGVKNATFSISERMMAGLGTTPASTLLRKTLNIFPSHSMNPPCCGYLSLIIKDVPISGD
jgi:hypothetical protein